MFIAQKRFSSGGRVLYVAIRLQHREVDLVLKCRLETNRTMVHVSISCFRLSFSGGRKGSV